MKTLNEARKEFKIKSSDFINGRLSPLAFDEWFLKTLKASREDVVGQIIDQYKIIRTDEAFVTYLNSLREDNL